MAGQDDGLEFSVRFDLDLLSRVDLDASSRDISWRGGLAKWIV